MTLPLFDRAASDLPQKLIEALSDGTWQHRDWLSQKLGVSVRQIRDAASQSHGQIVSGQKGLRLTHFCSSEEIADALAIFRSQIHEMTVRSLAITHVWEKEQVRIARKSA